MKRLSIRLQSTLMVLLLTLLTILVLTVAAYIEFEESLLENVDIALRVMGEGIWAELDEQESRLGWMNSDILDRTWSEINEEDRPERREAEFRAITARDTSARHTRYRIWTETDKEGAFLSDPCTDSIMQQLLHPSQQEQPAVGESTLFTIVDKTRLGPFRVIWTRRADDRGAVNILVACSCSYIYHEVGEFLRLLLVSGGQHSSDHSAPDAEDHLLVIAADHRCGETDEARHASQSWTG